MGSYNSSTAITRGKDSVNTGAPTSLFLSVHTVGSFYLIATVSTCQHDARNTARMPWTLAMETNPVPSGPHHPPEASLIIKGSDSSVESAPCLIGIIILIMEKYLETLKTKFLCNITIYTSVCDIITFAIISTHLFAISV